MNTKLSKLFVATSLVFAGAAMAEQTIGVQSAPTVAKATARVDVSVVVPNIVILRVGVNDGSIASVAFTVAPTGGTLGTDSLTYTGAVPPVFATPTIVMTNPPGSTGILITDAWTNATAGAQLTCALSAHPTIATGFAIGATTAAGVPGTDTITVSGTTALAHPGANLTGCTGTFATAPITKLAPHAGTFTYAFTGAATTAAGSYGNRVTYTATTL
jgi:hypothetical protein